MVSASPIRWVLVTTAALAIGCAADPEPDAFVVEEADGARMIVVGTFDRSCANLIQPVAQCGRWELVVHLGAAAQPGALPLMSEDVSAENFVSEGSPGAQSCLVIGGTFEKGTIDVEDHGATLGVLLSGTRLSGFDADGVYEAARCPN